MDDLFSRVEKDKDNWYFISVRHLSLELNSLDWQRAMNERKKFCNSGAIQGQWNNKIYVFIFELESDAMVFQLRFG